MDDFWLGFTLSVCPMKKRCLLDATSMSTTREWQGYTTLSSSGPNSTCQTRESIMDGRSHAYTKSHMASSSLSLAYRHTCNCLCIPHLACRMSSKPNDPLQPQNGVWFQTLVGRGLR